MPSGVAKIGVLAIIALTVMGVLITHSNTFAEADDADKYLPSEFKPEVINSVNRVSSLMSTDDFINDLLNNPEMIKIMEKIDLDAETVRDILVNKGPSTMILYNSNESGEPVYTINMGVGRSAGDDAMKPLSSYNVVKDILVESYFINIKVKLSNDSLSIISISAEENLAMNINYGPYPGYGGAG